MTCLSVHRYKPGDTILSNCQPFIKILGKNCRGSRCDFCFKINRTLKRCTNCKHMFYCDKKCQTQDWKNGHKLECELPGFVDKICENPNWLILRLVFRIFSLLKLKPEKANKKLPLPNGSRRSFNDLLDHAESEKDNPVLIKVLTMMKSWMTLGGHGEIQVEDLLKLYSIHKTNGFSIMNEEESASIGHGLYIQPSIFDHCCKPNAFYSIQGTYMRIRAIGPILEGQPICISYIAEHMGRDERRATLKQRFRFDCHCERCEANVDADVDFSTLRDNIQKMYGQMPMRDFYPKTLALHKEILKMLRILYHEYDDHVTNQYMRMFHAIQDYLRELQVEDVESLLLEIINHVEITYGKDHIEYLILAMKLPPCGYEYLLKQPQEVRF